uniref:Checkpoint protein n=1 Tax=Simocephalus serrulatus TaxID=117539 RepID=A0A4Y7NPK5_9CRUS|nr:EOG090X0TJE [Simocephalus serrulatus]SVE94683.1 EOG090X0TJE [Simocephalus serrulatus]
MKFRGKMIDGNCIKQFMSILGCMTKLGKSCILRITTTHMYFVVRESQTISSSPLIWCTLEEGHFFSEFAMEGLSAADNEIYLEFVAENFVKTLSALKVSSTAKSVKIKLTKKLSSPCLTFEIDLPSGSNHTRLVVHDIPVNLVPRRLWSDYTEPDAMDPDISVHMPQLRLLKSIVERMKNLANMATLHITAEGSLTLTVETDTVSVTSHFDYLHVEKQKEDEASVTIELKRLSNFLANEQLSPSRVLCDVVQSKVMHLNFLSDSYSLQFYLPGINDQ